MPQEALSDQKAAAFHAYQIESLAKAGVDFLFASTIPSLSEAAGMASAMAQTGVPYVISFIISRNGLLLDGTSLTTAINAIDNSVSPAPLFYMANCCYPAFYRTAMEDSIHNASINERIIGLQANTSAKDGNQPFIDDKRDIMV